MNKKIKMIDLANNIANEEWNKIPLKISFEGDDFIFNREEKKYKQVDEDYISLCFPTYKLNDEVAILEDNTEEIEELEKEQEAIANPKTMMQEIRFYYDSNKMGDKINEIIRYIKRKEKNND